ncbi:hypothetical protein PPYR_01904 [Photinus pyralis]|uniref:Trans-1,2-dihydrobenzene-1,2-diol dehydrogenase n=2 Tax=Photinus pyralis TaxID=7054 RepID=A0A1Y1M984_PHOPY|nr:trans-1,2-dihydrobenzene-1,2-diol dehydrogenase-like isoform X2 [Photinus pyralis]KAB0804934.1 hypothetical protein PPYR_01904 [Photinus pyralis]
MALRWGIVSAGRISNDFTCALQTHPEAHHKVVAVAARKLGDAQEFATRHNIPKAYGSYEDLAKDKDVDVVYIGSINPSHLTLSKLMLDHGKHVLCEKPLTMNKKETEELIGHAKAKGLFLMEAIWSRTFPIYDVLTEQIANGAIGDVLQVNVEFGFPLTSVDRVNVKELGGSATLDIGVYALQFSQYVYRGLKPVSVTASGNLNKHGVDDTASIILMYPNGRTSVLTLNTRVQLANCATVYGTKGMLKIPLFWSPSTMVTPSGTVQRELPVSTAKYNFLNSNGLAYEAEEVRHCLAQGLTESPKVTHAESLELAELMDTVRKAIGVYFPQDG